MLRAVEGLHMECDLVRRLEAEVSRQRDVARRLSVDVDGKPPVSLVVFLPRLRGRPFNTVIMWLGQVSATSLVQR